MSFARLICFCAIVVLVQGCATSITPPEQVKEPVTVVLVDHGRHPSLVFPVEGNGSVLYAYGDWDFFALRYNNSSTGLVALLWPTQGGLGRRYLDQSPSSAPYADLFYTEETFRIEVERSRAKSLRKRLAGLFERHKDSRHFTDELSMTFVKVPEDYHLFNNCNHVIIRWLEELGCRTSGPAMFSSFRLVDQREAGTELPVPRTE